MVSPKRFGLNSLLCGGLAIPTAFVATYIQSIRTPGSGVLLDWLDRWGFVNNPERGPVLAISGVPEMREQSLLTLNDERAILLLLCLAVFLGVIAMCSALFAEYRRESTLLLGSGYVCGALSITLVHPLGGIIAFIVGIAAVLILRNRHDNLDTQPGA